MSSQKEWLMNLDTDNGEKIFSPSQNLFIYKSGATLDQYRNFCPAPTHDQVELLRRQVMFATAKLSQLKTTYQGVYNNVLESCNLASRSSSVIPPSETVVAVLEKMANEIEEYTNEVNELRKQLEEIDPVLKRQKELVRQKMERQICIDEIKGKLTRLPVFSVD